MLIDLPKNVSMNLRYISENIPQHSEGPDILFPKPHEESDVTKKRVIKEEHKNAWKVYIWKEPILTQFKEKYGEDLELVKTIIILKLDEPIVLLIHKIFVISLEKPNSFVSSISSILSKTIVRGVYRVCDRYIRNDLKELTLKDLLLALTKSKSTPIRGI